jgi:hypothetical protein
MLSILAQNFEQASREFKRFFGDLPREVARSNVSRQ